MRIQLKKILPLLLAAAISSPILLTGCEVHGRVYDSYDHQYHPWAPENGYYVQWENETHRKHERYQRRKHDEQQDYWQWRSQRSGDRDRDHDRDHDRDRH